MEEWASRGEGSGVGNLARKVIKPTSTGRKLTIKPFKGAPPAVKPPNPSTQPHHIHSITNVAHVAKPQASEQKKARPFSYIYPLPFSLACRVMQGERAHSRPSQLTHPPPLYPFLPYPTHPLTHHRTTKKRKTQKTKIHKHHQRSPSFRRTSRRTRGRSCAWR